MELVVLVVEEVFGRSRVGCGHHGVPEDRQDSGFGAAFVDYSGAGVVAVRDTVDGIVAVVIDSTIDPVSRSAAAMSLLKCFCCHHFRCPSLQARAGRCIESKMPGGETSESGEEM